ncbi:MAG: cobalamin-dependent protein [Pseudomonadota bacterium]
MTMSKGDGVIGAGSAVLRRVMSSSLARRKPKGATNGLANSATLSDDPVNEIIEADIIPRLLMAHSGGQATTSPSVSVELDHPEFETVDAERFALLPLKLDATNLIEEIDGLLDRGVSVQSIYVDLLGPAARSLGEMWERDECDFVEVTMGLWRLQEVMRDLSARAWHSRPLGEPVYSALFVQMPGDTHGFGSQMIEEVFAQAGWQSEALIKSERRELLGRLSQKAFDLVGLTISRDCPSSAISSIVKAMRSVSANPNISIMIGGNVINNDPSLVEEVGADGTAPDARAALSIAKALVNNAPNRIEMVR